MSSETRDKSATLYIILECTACLGGDSCTEPCQLIMPYGPGDDVTFLESQTKEGRLSCMLNGCDAHGWKITERIQVNREEEL